MSTTNRPNSIPETYRAQDQPLFQYFSITTPKFSSPKDLEEARFATSDTAMEIVNGYTKSHEDKKPGLSQIEHSEKLKEQEVRQSTGRHLLYRYEMNGIVVYDSHARRCDDSPQQASCLGNKPPVTAAIKREIESAPEYDRTMYRNMASYPRTKTVPEEYTLVIPLENTLRFDSKFESGNLRKAIKICDDEYILQQDYDVDTKGHTQWFYFSVRNEKAGQKVRFNIVNLMKYDSLYNNGMKPLVLSLKKERKTGVSWHRTGDLVSYYQNNIPRSTLTSDSHLPHFHYTLSFTYTFEHDRDLVYFAHCYPYTYTDLGNYLNRCMLREDFADVLRVDTLCTTDVGNPCYVLTITQNVKTYMSWEDEYSLMLKSAAGRKMIRQREERKEAHLKMVEQVRNVKLVTG